LVGPRRQAVAGHRTILVACLQVEVLVALAAVDVALVEMRCRD
jgi:hypothetical protein